MPDSPDSPRPRTPDLLDILAHNDRLPDCPDGMVLGWRSTTPDLRSSHDYRWPWPGQWAEAPDDGRNLDPSAAPNSPCPSATLGGLCLARTWWGARSGDVPAMTALIVAYHESDVLGVDVDKRRVARCLILDVIDVTTLNLNRANLYGANLNRASLYVASLDGASLDGANLYGASLYGANLNRASLDGASLYGANLNRASLDGANLNRASLYGASLYGANLNRASLDGANLNRASLDGANLYGASLYGANLDGANLNGANLDGASLIGASLNRARANRWTRWPVGFDAAARGVVTS